MESQWRRWKPGVCELGVDPGSAENTYATKKVILEVELEVGVLLNGAKDLTALLAKLKEYHRA